MVHFNAHQSHRKIENGKYIYVNIDGIEDEYNKNKAIKNRFKYTNTDKRIPRANAEEIQINFYFF